MLTPIKTFLKEKQEKSIHLSKERHRIAGERKRKSQPVIVNKQENDVLSKNLNRQNSFCLKRTNTKLVSEDIIKPIRIKCLTTKINNFNNVVGHIEASAMSEIKEYQNFIIIDKLKALFEKILSMKLLVTNGFQVK